MTESQVIKELSSYIYLKRDAERLAKRRDEMFSLACKTTANYGAVTVTGGGNALSPTEKYIDLANQYEEKRIEAESQAIALENKINCIDEPYRSILKLRYIDGLTLYEVSEKINYCYRHTRRLYYKSLKYIDKK